MSFQGSSFYSTLYETFVSLKIEEYFPSASTHLIFPVQQRFPTLWASKQWCSISIPNIYQSNENLVYCQLAFSRDEFGYSSLARLLLASTALLTSKAIVSAFHNIAAEKWIESTQNALNASIVLNSIFD